MEKALEIIKEKEEADAPVAHYQGKGVTKGKGRFGPFIKYDGMFINVPRAYDFDNLSQNDINELIEKKLEKEANRYIQNWSEEKISVENARWGPQIKFGKLQLKLIKNGGGKFTPDELAALTLDEVKAMIIAQVPKAFDKKGAKKSRPGVTKKAKVVKLAGETSTKKAAVKKAASKKTAPKKVAAKKSPAKKAAAKKK
jgi:DNA topoisomerase-1